MRISKGTGYKSLYGPKGYLLLGLLSLVMSIIGASTAMSVAFVLGLVVLIVVASYIIKFPAKGLDLLLVFSFFISGLGRIIALPFGLVMDVMLAFIWLIVILQKYPVKAANALVFGHLFWALFCVLQLFNPLAKSVMAWFYAARQLAFTLALIIPLLFVLKQKIEDYQFFYNSWFVLSVFLSLYGLKQYTIGVFGFEQHWLDTAGGVTHVLWGRFTRMFSFLSDANQFGCSQGHVASVSGLFLLQSKGLKQRVFYGLTSLLCFVGMFISGTRGAIVIPGVTFIVFIFLNRNIKLIVAGLIMGAVGYHIMANTFLFHSIEVVRRMRTAFNPTEDRSFQVRVENRARLDAYMQDKPFGGGVGSAGFWGKRFSPNSFLANFETDGHYVRLYAETGVIGLNLYLILYLVMIGKMALISWNLKDPVLKNRSIALTGGVCAIMAANYSNAVLIGLPTMIVSAYGMVYVFQTKRWDQERATIDA